MNSDRQFSVYKSSAGSGKTYTLVREYILLALQRPAYFRHILAITFTNKAANEMKQRILRGLEQLANPSMHRESATVQHMLPELAAALAAEEAVISKRADDALTMVLHSYDDFAVRTIDSFVTRIIRMFAHDLHLPVDFEIELDTDALIDRAFDQLMSRIGVDKDVTRILVEFTQSKLDDESSWQIGGALKTTAKLLFQERSYAFLNKIRTVEPDNLLHIISALRRSRKDFSDKLSKIAGNARQLIDANGISDSSFAQGASGVGGYFRKIQAGKPEMPSATVAGNMKNNNWFSGKCTAADREAISRIADELAAYYSEIEKELESGLPRYKLLGIVENNIYQLGVLLSLEEEVGNIRTDTQTIHISEFNRRITDIIVGQPVPFIYERTGEKYHNYLIDEFQDTSELQWKNLLPLLGNSLSEARYNLVVGDAKQAIYRFRNGNVEQFVQLPALPDNFDREVFGDAGAALARNYNPFNLEQNYRSLPEIVSFNNGFFNFIAKELSTGYASIYDKLEQTAVQKEGGYVQVDLLPVKSKKLLTDANLIRIHEIIADLTVDGYAWKDITILTRSNKEGSLVARSLLNAGIQVVSSEALLLSSSAEVNFLISVLSWLHDRRNKICLAHILNELLRRSIIRGELVSEFMNDRNQLPDLQAVLSRSGIDFDAGVLTSMPLYDLCEEIIRIFGFNKGKYNVFLQFFLDFVSKVERKQGSHLADLLDAWEEKKSKLSIVVPAGVDAVQVMTIHKAKGLEFPVVIWPMATAELKYTMDTLWIDLPPGAVPGLPVALVRTGKQLAETGYAGEFARENDSSLLDLFNMVYVAFTRPVERLYVISQQADLARVKGLPSYLTGFINSEPGKWTSMQNGYFRGLKHKKLKLEKAGDGGTETLIQEMISTAWQSRIRIAKKNTSVITGSGLSVQEWGNVFHQVIASLQQISELENVVEKTAGEFRLTESDKAILLTKVQSLVSHPQLKELFGAGVRHKAEQGILTPLNELYRPDRIIFRENETVILEFKTGLPDPKHNVQISEYAALLAQMGYQNIKKLLVYIDNETKVIEC